MTKTKYKNVFTIKFDNEFCVYIGSGSPRAIVTSREAALAAVRLFRLV